MTNKNTKTSKTSKSNPAHATANEDPHTTAGVAEQGAPVASPKAASKKVTSRKKTDTPEAPQNPRAPKPESKGAQLLALIGREQGASLTELRQLSGWQAHSVRGFISTAGKKHNVKIASGKSETVDRVYSILR